MTALATQKVFRLFIVNQPERGDYLFRTSADGKQVTVEYLQDRRTKVVRSETVPVKQARRRWALLRSLGWVRDPKFVQ